MIFSPGRTKKERTGNEMTEEWMAEWKRYEEEAKERRKRFSEEMAASWKGIEERNEERKRKWAERRAKRNRN